MAQRKRRAQSRHLRVVKSALRRRERKLRLWPQLGPREESLEKVDSRGQKAPDRGDEGPGGLANPGDRGF
jgi:hypothetical protein